ncbi:glycoside hydrolase family 2 TIM barrel-domain containing protein [uncultured Winogradskyella sp.]|uniref:glycoside hydrolase family 2 TIM barrel-domain containing protein n=1 Tax=uncultured Winogradskyella sp. TaxID=395353 RepID=UPI00263318F0|nr:glycoside hydrolase family 2 TIM barrel-domain containing protein [uncultured Winogradskyella sp.]
MRTLILVLFFTTWINAQTTVEKINEHWILKVDGQPFNIKGATFGYDKDVNNYDNYFKDLKFLGVNTVRTWATGKNTKALLDAAQKHDIKVMVGIWMRHGRPGMEDDDHFDYLTDTEGMEVMYRTSIEVVETYKSHPAVLTWGVANEVYLNMATDEEKMAYSKFLERVCSQIKTLDSNHPITSVEAWTFGLDWWEKYVPSIDIYGLNSYGIGANFLQEELDKRNIDKPYIVTEFGVTGEWDIKNEKYGVKVEPTDTDKYDAIANGYKNWIANKEKCLGVYVFHYGSGNDFASAWLLTHFNNSYRPQYWAIREAYTGNLPNNYVPKIEFFELPEKTYKSGTWIPVNLKVSDAENESLEVNFSYNQRTGSRKRRNQINAINHRGNLSEGFEIQLPEEHGAIKVYVNVKDSSNNLGMASNAIQVIDEKAKAIKFKVPKVSLPFYIYNNGEELPYLPSGYMGNYKAMDVDLNSKDEAHTGKTSIKISYNAVGDWYGLAFVDPANDWGDILGGYNISGAKTFSFWAKASFDDVYATIGFGLIDADKPFPDTAKKSIEIKLTNQWKKYTIKTKKLDLSCIRSGLVLFSNGNGFPYKIYIDDVVFE